MKRLKEKRRVVRFWEEEEEGEEVGQQLNGEGIEEDDWTAPLFEGIKRIGCVLPWMEF